MALLSAHPVQHVLVHVLVYAQFKLSFTCSASSKDARRLGAYRHMLYKKNVHAEHALNAICEMRMLSMCIAHSLQNYTCQG
jgi:hypothetical protein